MNCDSAKAILQSHVDRLLMPIDRADVAEHLRSCAACSREAAQYRALGSALDALPEPPLPSSFTHSVMSQLPEMLPAEEGPGHLLRWGVAAAAASFAFLAGLAVLVEGAGPDVAHQVLDPMAGSLKVAGLLLGEGATLVAAFLDTVASALVTTDLAVKLAFCALLVLTNAALAAVIARTRPILSRPRSRDRTS